MLLPGMTSIKFEELLAGWVTSRTGRLREAERDLRTCYKRLELRRAVAPEWAGAIESCRLCYLVASIAS